MAPRVGFRRWFVDTARALLAPWYWNWRKTRALRRDPAARCPGSSPSDDPLRCSVRCEASFEWHDRTRFARYVCPSLARDADADWACTTPNSPPRPWGRPLALWAAFAVVLVGVAVGGTWFALRRSGFDVRLAQIVWPPAWSEIRSARAEHFLRLADAELARGNLTGAILALEVAYTLQPLDLNRELALAELHHYAATGNADIVYRRALQLHPERRAVITRAWLLSVLLRGESISAGALGAEMLQADPGDEWPLWLHQIRFDARLRRDWTALRLLAEASRPPAIVRELAALEWQARTSPPADARYELRTRPLAPHAYALVQRCELLIEFGEARAASTLLERQGRHLAWRDLVRLRLSAAAGTEDFNRVVATVLVGPAPAAAGEPTIVTALALHALSHPGSGLLPLCLQQPPATPGPRRDHELAALYCLATLEGTPEQMESLREQMSDQYRLNAADHAALSNEVIIRRRPSALRLLRAIHPTSMDLNLSLLVHEKLRTRALPGGR